MRFLVLAAAISIVGVSFFVASALAARGSAPSPTPLPSSSQGGPCTRTCTPQGTLIFNSPTNAPACYDMAKGAAVTWDLSDVGYGQCSLAGSCPNTLACSYVMSITVNANNIPVEEFCGMFTIRYNGAITPIATCSSCHELSVDLGLGDPPDLTVDCYNTDTIKEIDVEANGVVVWRFELRCKSCV